MIRLLCLYLVLLAIPAAATIVGTVRGVVHDPSHRPTAGAEVTLRAEASSFAKTLETGDDGQFAFVAVPAGAYRVEVRHAGFAAATQRVVMASGSVPVLHFQLKLAEQRDSVEVAESASAVDPSSSTPETLVSRQDIEKTPGAALSNSLAMITNFVPGAYITHDQLHVRGGHQTTWAIDGIPIPN